VTAAGAQRWAGLDLVRATAMLLGLAYHGVFAYLPGIGPYYVVQDPATQGALASLGATLHAFRMEVFFTLAGFFAHLLLERRGVNGFLRDRARRLLVPFTVALPLSIVADVMLRRWSSARGTLSPAYQPPLDALRLAPLHLWFLEYVFLFCAATWLLVRLFGQPKRQWDAAGPRAAAAFGAADGVGAGARPRATP
jgi:glucan biosynthesis protein C